MDPGLLTSSSCLVVLESDLAGVLFGVEAAFGVEVAVGLMDLLGVFFTVFSLLSPVPGVFFLALALTLVDAAVTLFGGVVFAVFLAAGDSVFAFPLRDAC